jgi:hypothetical protein
VTCSTIRLRSARTTLHRAARRCSAPTLRRDLAPTSVSGGCSSRPAGTRTRRPSSSTFLRSTRDQAAASGWRTSMFPNRTRGAITVSS